MDRYVRTVDGQVHKLAPKLKTKEEIVAKANKLISIRDQQILMLEAELRDLKQQIKKEGSRKL